MVYAITYTLLEFINFSMTYIVIFNKKLKKKKWVYIIPLLLICFIQTFVFCKLDFQYMYVVNVFTGLVIPILWIEGKKFRKYYCIRCYNVFYSFYKKEKNISNSISVIDIRQYILIIMGMFDFFIIIAFIQGLGEYNFKEKDTLWLGFAVSNICIVWIILCFWQMITLKRQDKYIRRNIAYEEYMRMQENEIQMIINKDENMRRFRHDLYAHIIALETISDRSGNNELTEYISKMKKESAVNSIKIYSGISAVDAVVREIEERTEKDNISIQWEGRLGTRANIDIYDLCTIFSNLLTNAVEACLRNENEERIIYVKVYQYEKSIYINVKNSCKDKVIIEKDNTIKTRKNDSKNHGLGTKNVKDTVERNKGSIEYILQNGWFEVKIVI